MANSQQAKKRARQANVRRGHNASLRSMVRTQIKKVIAAIITKNAATARTAFNDAEPMIDSMVNKGILTKNKAARHKHRLVKQIKALAA